ncbi:MAG: hypothetical protein H6917_04440 [Novosphingobium sp.]|nr:hypothetical protein [Novosphingobium sp.]MCP5401623.1 hypothetical protein [Novosphingobium sp.]
MKRILHAALCLALVPLGAAEAESPTAQRIYSDETQVGKIADEFFDLLKAGKASEAYDVTLGSSPLMKGRETDKQSLVEQLNSAIQIYGAVSRVEQVAEERQGAMVIRRRYIAQHEKMVTRWQIDFARLPGGWSVVYLGFDDKVANWD